MPKSFVEPAALEDEVEEAGKKSRRRKQQQATTLTLEEFAAFHDELITTVKHQVVKTEELNSTIARLSDNMENLSDTIRNSFRVFSMGAKVFRLVIWAFITVIAILGAIIVYITQVDIDPMSGKITTEHEKSIQDKILDRVLPEHKEETHH